MVDPKTSQQNKKRYSPLPRRDFLRTGGALVIGFAMGRKALLQEAGAQTRRPPAGNPEVLTNRGNAPGPSAERPDRHLDRGSRR